MPPRKGEPEPIEAELVDDDAVRPEEGPRPDSNAAIRYIEGTSVGKRRGPVEVNQDIANALRTKFPHRFFVREPPPNEAAPTLLLDTRASLVPVGDPLLLRYLSQAVLMEKTGSYPAPEMRSFFLNTADQYFPVVEWVAHHPVLTRDGRIVRSGYDERTRTFVTYRPRAVVKGTDAIRDQVILDLLQDFDFLSGADMVHALGMFLLPLVRPWIGDEPTPLHFVQSEYPASGKTYLSRCLSLIATGSKNGAIGLSQASALNASMELDTMLKNEPVVVLADNIRTGSAFNPPELLQAITQVGYKPFRANGTSNSLQYRVRCTWVFNGNLPKFPFEMARRVVPIRLGRGHDPNHYTFRNADLHAHLAARRDLILAGLLRMVEVWLENPITDVKLLPSFERWSRIVGGILTANGFGDEWLASAHRPLTEEARRWGALWKVWPRTTPRGAGEDLAVFTWQSPKQVLALIDNNNLDWPDSENEPRYSGQGRLTEIGRLLREIGEREAILCGRSIEAKTQGNNRFYRPSGLDAPP